MTDKPFALHITWTCYGTWLPGDARGWVEDVQFTDGGARVRGSIESSSGGEAETCHRLRGILSRLTEIATKERSRLSEVECASTGARECVFSQEES